MLDQRATTLIKPLVLALARQLARWGVSANHATFMGFALGLIAAVLITQSYFVLGWITLLLSRAMDALDGAIARQTQATDAGGFLDITLDFLFYAMIPLAFAVANPSANALPAAVLLASFIGTGSSFLAFAVLAAKRGITNLAVPNKSFYFLGGLTEATETLIVFSLMCLWPNGFAYLAYGFAVLCAFTTATRIASGWQQLNDSVPPAPPSQP